MQKRLVALLFSFGLGAFLESFALFELFTSRFFPAAATAVVLLSHLAACLVLVPGFLLLLPSPYRKEKWLSFYSSLDFRHPSLWSDRVLFSSSPIDIFEDGPFA